MEKLSIHKRIKDTAFLAFLNEQDLIKLLDYSSIKLFSANEYITRRTEYLMVLIFYLKEKLMQLLIVTKQNVRKKY